MKCERCGKELADVDLYCPRCGKAVFEKYMDEEDVWAYYKSDEELARILEEEEKKAAPQESQEAESEHVPEGLQEDGKEPSQVREAVCAEESSSPEQVHLSCLRQRQSSGVRLLRPLRRKAGQAGTAGRGACSRGSSRNPC